MDAAWWFRRAAKQAHPVATSMIDSGHIDSGTDNSELHDEDSDGWEFVEAGACDRRLGGDCRGPHHQLELTWEVLDGGFAPHEWEEKAINAPQGKLHVLF